MKVIDASALAKFLLKEAGWQEVCEELKEGVLSTDLVLKEVSNVVLKRHRRGELSREEADSALMALKRLLGSALKIEDEAGYVDEALGIAMGTGITIYDAIYIVFSRAKSLTLLTADRGQAKAALEKGLNVRLVD
ncbi:MAG: type II toxin-antitoxin system VapC family toxin [Candidatus Brockarchaeota archaeon]|nr:type II toxin-antitoxin system VapC family toxin [Candidatus Brockarchaeota archaeon]MBO3809446.1 type II toxin-antitoxin system VapC family toxin [Candidatus Brockarchaeota archaeon]MBO3842941.1 type II toxin-antitoxin system VapC family toxin [Candidatus Brockarchaeota archaeon]